MAEDALLGVDTLDVLLRLFAAVLVGAFLGLEREWRGKPVGIRTLALVSLGAALVSIVSVHLEALQGQPDAVSRAVQGVIQGVMAGIGFIGAGAVLHRDRNIYGVTTAATVWVTAALGIACGLASWRIVLVGAALTLFVLVVLHPLDALFERRRAEEQRKRPR